MRRAVVVTGSLLALAALLGGYFFVAYGLGERSAAQDEPALQGKSQTITLSTEGDDARRDGDDAARRDGDDGDDRDHGDDDHDDDDTDENS